MMEHVDVVIAAINDNSEDPEPVERGLRCLRNLAVNDDNRVPLLKALPSIVAAIQEHEEVEDMVSACLCVCACACMFV
jgi:hypothetical protein